MALMFAHLKRVLTQLSGRLKSLTLTWGVNLSKQAIDLFKQELLDLMN